MTIVCPGIAVGIAEALMAVPIGMGIPIPEALIGIPIPEALIGVPMGMPIGALIAVPI